MGQLPLVKASKTFGLNLDLPSQIQDVLNNVAKLGIKADDIKTMELNYTNLIHEILSEENLDIALRKPKCRKAIENQNVIVIRGYIKGKLKAISDDSLEIDPKIKFVEMGEFNVKYKDKGGFSIEDLQSRPRFIIVTETRAETTLSTLTETKSDKSKIFTTSGKHKESKKEVKKETKEDAKPAGKVKEEFSIQYSRPKDESIEALFSGKPNRSP